MLYIYQKKQTNKQTNKKQKQKHTHTHPHTPPPPPKGKRFPLLIPSSHISSRKQHCALESIKKIDNSHYWFSCQQTLT